MPFVAFASERSIYSVPMRTFALCLLAGTLFTTAAHAADRDAISYVNPLIGTQKSSIGYGAT
ncbi:MAG: hypothetical protein ABI197_05080, partial [Granulicella sp.]